MKKKIIIADDHAIIRDGLRALLDTQDDMEVIGDTGNGSEIVALAQRLHPEIIIMDINLPGQSGIEATRAIHAKCPDICVVILSLHDTLEYTYQALSAGACGYLVKESAVGEIVAAIRAISTGEIYISIQIQRLIVDYFLKSFSPVSAARHLELLSSREREILQQVLAGKSSKEIAWNLAISSKTVDTYRSRLMEKLGVHDLPSLTRLCIELGIIGN